eukprot:6287921-Amphidinium_carterae.1
MLPESSILREVKNFRIYTNRFTGALPDGGMRAMLAVTCFLIALNSFTGTLPESGSLREVRQLYMYSNRLAGMLPEGICVEAVTKVYIQHNCFAGTVAECLPLNSNPKLSTPKK